MPTHTTTMPTRPAHRRAAGAVALAAGLLLAGCGGEVEEGASAPSGGAATASAADVDFLTGMIPHHRQATEMAGLVEGRTEDPDVVALAEEIEAAQQPEIEEMSALLESYGEAVPEEMDHGAMGHGDMSGSSTGGMMSPEQMAELEGLSGEEFDRAWLSMMVEHHEGAVAMAEEATAEAEQPEVLALADEIATAQESEIATMQDLLAQG